MNPDYSISSDGFLVDNLRDVLENLVEVTDALLLEFFVIGAIARDIFIHQIHGLQPQRATGDLDIAIALLKLIAWSDDRRRRQKDAQDLCQLMRSYADVLGTDFYIVHQDIVDDPDFDADIGSARALGRDVGSILVDSRVVAETVAEILEQQTADLESQLALDMGPRAGR